MLKIILFGCSCLQVVQKHQGASAIALKADSEQFEKVARLTSTHDYELPALGGLFAGPLGVLPDLDAVLGSKHRKHNIGHEEGLCHFLHTLGMA